jgi:hypothetical protein
MKANDMLTQVKELLGMEVEAEKVELAQMKLENGTVLEAESFEAGKEVFIVTEDEKVAVPVGEYKLEDDKVLVITEEGIIAEIKDAEEKSEEVEEETEAKEEEEVEAAEEEKEEMRYATKEELAEVKSMIEEIKAMLEPKEDLSEEVKEEVKEEQLSAQDSEEVQKINHSPESVVEKKMNLFANKRPYSTINRVFNNLTK